MRDRDQRLRWIEKLIGGVQQSNLKLSALVVPTDNGSLALAFSSIEELMTAEGVTSIAFLPSEFCGVLHRGNDLAPVVDLGGGDEEPAHVVLVKGAGCLLGLRFRGTPYVVDLSEIERTVQDIRFERKPGRATLPLLDTEAAIASLLDRD